jgi:hypothetical protein
MLHLCDSVTSLAVLSETQEQQYTHKTARDNPNDVQCIAVEGPGPLIARRGKGTLSLSYKHSYNSISSAFLIRFKLQPEPIRHFFSRAEEQYSTALSPADAGASNPSCLIKKGETSILIACLPVDLCTVQGCTAGQHQLQQQLGCIQAQS